MHNGYFLAGKTCYINILYYNKYVYLPTKIFLKRVAFYFVNIECEKQGIFVFIHWKTFNMLYIYFKKLKENFKKIKKIVKVR